MSPIVWDESYSVGEPVIDQHHRALIDLINALDDDTEIGFILEQLTLYVAEHFRAEEQLMKEKETADLDSHKLLHKEFEEWLMASKQAYRTGGTGGIALKDNIRSYLRNWLIHHIKGSDQKSFGHTPAS